MTYNIRSHHWKLLTLSTMVLSTILVAGANLAHSDEPELPTIRREFRAAWVATVANIDWPSKRDLSVADQKKEFLAILDSCEQLNLNALILQVRPSCDALYDSELEPWSVYLTGKMGRAPEPFYDPLEFAVEESHKRGIELHVWFNPYRARHSSAPGEVSDDHISVTNPDVVREYGSYLWLDPGEPEATDHTMAVIMDVVKRYDIDGVHMDDYFYPYPIQKDGKNVPFPDDQSWERAQAGGVTMDRDDWRRDNVNQLVKRIHEEVKAEKPWVMFGISPFGIWRPGNPPQIQGLDQYNALYADAKLWLNEGWVDYYTPQLYWKLGPPQQSYAALLHWWNEQNTKDRHLWPGNFTSRLLSRGSGWSADEIIAQIWTTRAQEGSEGNVHFSMKALQRNSDGIADALAAGPYRQPALVPASPWMKDPHSEAPAKPDASLRRMAGAWNVLLKHEGNDAPWQWVIRSRYDDGWQVDIVSGSTERHALAQRNGRPVEPDAVAVSSVNRVGKESEVVWAKK